MLALENFKKLSSCMKGLLLVPMIFLVSCDTSDTAHQKTTVTDNLVLESSISHKAPRLVVQEIVSKLKNKEGPSIVIDYIHWPTAFASLEEHEKSVTLATSSEELRDYFKKFLIDPKEVLTRQFESQLQSMPIEERDVGKEMMGGILAGLVGRFEDERKRLVDSEYEVGDQKIEEDHAEVELRISYQGSVEQESIKLIKVGDKWYLPGVDQLTGRVKN